MENILIIMYLLRLVQCHNRIHHSEAVSNPSSDTLSSSESNCSPSFLSSSWWWYYLLSGNSHPETAIKDSLRLYRNWWHSPASQKPFCAVDDVLDRHIDKDIVSICFHIFDIHLRLPVEGHPLRAFQHLDIPRLGTTTDISLCQVLRYREIRPGRLLNSEIGQRYRKI